MNPSQSTASVLPLDPQMLDLLPAAVDLCDAEGVLRYYNRRAAELWGREPRCGDGGERFCGAFRLFRPDGSPLDHAATPMADALRTGQATRDGEVIMERPDGSRVTVMIESEAIRDGDGHIIGAIDVFQDITERKRLFDELRRGEERFRRLLSALPAAVYTTDQEGRITFVNAAAAELWGRLPDIGHEMWCGSFRMYRPDGTPLPHDQCPMAVALREGRSVLGQEIVVERSDGTRVCALPHPVPLRDDSGEVIEAVNMLIDISDRKRAEAQLRESEARFRAIVEATPDCVKLVSPDGTLLEMNPAGLGMLEVDRAEDILGRCLYDVIAPEQREAYREFNERVCAGVGGTLEFDIVGLRGTRRKMETRAVPLRDAQGRLICGAVTRDVSERKRVDAALRASEEKYRTLADNVQQLFWTCLPDGRCDYLSRQWVDYTGIPEAEQLGLYWLPLVIHPEDQGRTLTAWMKALEDGLYDLEYRIRGADGRYRWFKTRGTPIRDDHGTITKWFGTCTDIDDQKRAEEALKENDRRKDEFLAMLAHELRNPLAPILNAVHILGHDQAAGPTQRQAASLIER
ncbi:MAG: PAS domain S-box protein, partial [Singulisphaera sp.]|nr:PAS domain S-box protein [Singulisphaera sp.]